MPHLNFITLSPEEYKHLEEFPITYGFVKSKFGPCLIGIQDKQLCYVAFYDEGKEKSIVGELKNDWPNCTIHQDDDAVKPFAKKIFDNNNDDELDVLLKGTDMQISVWKELINIKAGTTLDYGGVAKAIGKPKAVRAVATTVSKNKIAYLIPCHRVINKSVILKDDDLSSNVRNKLENFPNITYTSDITNDSTCYDAIICGASQELSEEFFKQIQNRLNGGGLYIVLTQNDAQKIEFLLKTNGFINVVSEQNETRFEIKGFKPTYDVGSSQKLNLKPKPQAPAAVWKLDDINDDDVETIDPDDLLDEDDFKKPEQSSLRVCGTTGKRKACKDCSCGLAAELDAEAASQKPVNSSEAKSSCGSCYLGDAFRCATCPYLGMPAFKPGEKVELPKNFLKADS
ncbi:hypothetical protein RN001_009625 [Aquatica leii]|uniref:Anamorsin homolog n=1 Tax=Aquatica leii TaxID=1421715 RepID=A0AAN7P517_9COLE|nr:hypothetical protein RN001_009625 [Aquatica leii]